MSGNTVSGESVIHSHSMNDIKINMQHSIFLTFFFLFSVRFSGEETETANTFFMSYTRVEEEEKIRFIVGFGVRTMNFNLFHALKIQHDMLTLNYDLMCINETAIG